MALLGVDIGSSSCKAVVFDEAGRRLASGHAGYEPEKPRANWVELDANKLFDAFAVAVRQATGGYTGRVEALAVSSHGESYVPVAPDGRAVGNMVMNADNRAVNQAARLEMELGRERLYAITGSPPHPMFGLTKIMWQKEHGGGGPDRYLSAGDFILRRLGCGAVTDYSLASRMFGFDIAKKAWSKEILDAAGVAASELPEPVPAGTLAGALSPGMAAELGLGAGAKVIVGGHDQPCGALGSGVVRPGDAMNSAGTYECAAVASERPMNTPQALRYNLNSYCHVVPGQYITLAFFAAGVGVRWLVDELCALEVREAEEKGIDVYDMLEKRVADYPGPTGMLVVPHWVGACNPYWDVTATGVVAGLTPFANRFTLYKAAYEGIACELRANVQVLESVGCMLPVLRISGGGARSRFTVQLRADITGKAMALLNTSETVCQGAAMLAGIGTGVFRDFADAVERMVGIQETIHPNADGAAAYHGQCARYAELIAATVGRGRSL